MEFTRLFDEGRKQQGFKSQAHLDAFFSYMDHKSGCAECQQVRYFEFDDGVQPALNSCAVARDLFRASFSENF